MLNIDIDNLIPHREKIKIVTGVHSDIQDMSAVSSATVTSEWPLYDGQAADSLVLIEAIAQTAAIVEGYKKKTAGESGVRDGLSASKTLNFTWTKYRWAPV